MYGDKDRCAHTARRARNGVTRPLCVRRAASIVWNLRTPDASVQFPSIFRCSSLGRSSCISSRRDVPRRGRRETMIDGLKLTFSGEELRTLLEDRIADHNGAADHWRREQARTPESQTDEAPLLPDHMCEHEEERQVWRADVLEFIRNHVDPQETYRLSAADLRSSRRITKSARPSVSNSNG